MITHRRLAPLMNSLACLICLGLHGSMRLTAQVAADQSQNAPARLLSNPPETRSPIVLTAINDSSTGKAAFSFQGREDPPLIRARPGEDLFLTYVDAMSTDSHEMCIDGPCKNMTNLHFHGLHVSPDSPQDDIITMMAMPGQSLHYVVNIPLDQPPGLYWYHTHPHGESYQQYLDGMSGAIVIDGIERYVPELQQMRERILVLRDQVIDKDNAASPEWMRRVELFAEVLRCFNRSTRAHLHRERSRATANRHRPGRTTILAHCECLTRPLRGLAGRWGTTRDCCSRWDAPGVSRPGTSR